MRIIGIDPGLQITGFAVVEPESSRHGIIQAGVIRTDPHSPLASRLTELHEGLSQILAETRPEVAVVEELYSHYGHPRTAILMGHARGVIYLTAAENSMEVKSYSATHIKKSLTGNGRASKEQVQKSIQALLHLKSIPEPPDIADALAVALCHANVLRHNIKLNVTRHGGTK